MDDRHRASRNPEFRLCLISVPIGAILAMILSTYSVSSVTEGPIPAQNDSAISKNSVFQVFGVDVSESTGPWATHHERFDRFADTVKIVFGILGALIGFEAVKAMRRPLEWLKA